MSFPNNLYLYPLFGAILVCFAGLVRSKPKRIKQAEVSLSYNGVDKPFDNSFSNLLYRLSFSKPYVWFIPETPIHPKAVSRNAVIATAEMTNKLDYRAFTVLQTSLLSLSMISTFIIYLLLRQSDFIIRFFFNIDMSEGSNTTVLSVFIGILLLMGALVPNMYLNYIAGKKTESFIAELPLIQLFLILMIRSKRPIGEILYTLSKNEGRFKNIFSTGYRIFLRDKDAGFDYLQSAFGKSSFRDSIVVLSTAEEYEKEYSAEALESKMPTLLDDVAASKKNRGVLRGLLSEGSIALPFVAVMLLGVGPILYSVMLSMNSIFGF